MIFIGRFESNFNQDKVRGIFIDGDIIKFTPWFETEQHVRDYVKQWQTQNT